VIAPPYLSRRGRYDNARDLSAAADAAADAALTNAGSDAPVSAALLVADAAADAASAGVIEWDQVLAVLDKALAAGPQGDLDVVFSDKADGPATGEPDD
jgi:hypothetical protein